MTTTSTTALTVEEVTRQHTELTGHAPDGVWAAPGRVNLIGEHTDYNDGFVMPFALPQRALLGARRRDDEQWLIASLDLDESSLLGVEDLVPGSPGWVSYLAGVVWALREAGHAVGGADLVLHSDVPLGAGLSSSAALECVTVAALVDLFDLDIAPLERAKLARRAENAYVGAPTGLLDQAASTLCREGEALFMDCRSGEVEQVPFAPGEEGLEVLVLDTKVPHSHVDGEYGERRASCEEAARLIGVPALRDVTDLEDALGRLPEDRLRRRVRHVVTENARVLQAVEVLRAGRIRDLAPLLDDSHTSMRDDYEITVPAVDLAVETARAAGALGARMTGGGFGGCIIALVPAGSADEVGAAVSTALTGAGHHEPRWFTASPSAGARRIA
ncbi:galactokinase [Auraticoccus monumenti]|uniref:Galactokinase n=1 Tax=Auraticoccus monumenti TaxID=675864 RepID=A0A1G7AVL4_9ACTN|nr:galactokinase [Auraticoccus monumenti]SDE18833.1 galactokinase [Auraticoccus monumenti]